MSAGWSRGSSVPRDPDPRRSLGGSGRRNPAKVIRRSRIRGCVYCRETPFSSIRRHAEAGCLVDHPAPAPFERRRSVMNWMPRRLSSVELRVGRQLGIEDQFLGVTACSFLPEPSEVEGSRRFGRPCAARRWHSRRRGCSASCARKAEDTLLPSAPLGDIVLFDQGILAMEWDRVKIEVEGPPAGQSEPAHGVEPAAHQFRIAVPGRSGNCTRSR